MMEEDLRALILGDASVSSLVGTRVSWAERPQGGALPAIVLWVISQPVAYNLQGAQALTQTRVQADCWGATYAGAKGAAQALSRLLSGYEGEQGDTLFQGVFQDGAREGRDASANTTGSDPERFFRSSIDFIVNHQAKA